MSLQDTRSGASSGSSQDLLDSARPWAYAIALPLILGLLVVAALQFFPSSIARANFPFAENLWPEGPLIVQLHRMATGDAAYRPTHEVGSFVYGPIYLNVLSWTRSILHLPFSIVSFRWISMIISFLAIIPLALCSLLIAQRAGVQVSQPVPRALVFGTAALAGIAVLMRNITFDTIHPDGLLFLLVASSLLIYYAIVAGRIDPRYVWLLLGICLVNAFTKQNSALIFPILLWALVALSLLSFRIGMLASTVYVLAVAAGYLILTPEARLWTLIVPGSQWYDFSLREHNLWAQITYWEPFLGVLTVAIIFAFWFLKRMGGNRSFIIDAAALVGILVTALSGYFKIFGVWNNLALFGMFAVPYYAMLVGLLLSSSLERLKLWAAGVTVVAIGLATPLTLFMSPRQAPDPRLVAQMQTAQVYADQLCAKNQPIMVNMFPELFLNCPNASFALNIDFGQLASAYPRFYAGPTVMDYSPSETYVVCSDFYGMPLPLGTWLHAYHVVKRLPVPFGYGQTFYWPVTLLVYERGPQPASTHTILHVVHPGGA